MEEELEELSDLTFKVNSANKFNVALGFFQSYADAEADSSGKRFCNVKLHYKDNESNDIDNLLVPMAYIGTKRTVYDFELEQGDEMLILYSDRSLEQWKDTTGTEPQVLENPVKDSINHAIAVPIVSHHFVNLITTAAIPSDVGGRLGVKSGDKIQVGNDAVDLLKIVYDMLTELAAAAVQNVGAAATPSPLINQANFLALQTQLAQIAKF